ncbi:hypothetical protein ES706_02299 [subsurface metagenome]
MKRAFSKINKWITSLTVLAVTILFIGGCVPANQPPVITSLQAECELVLTLESCQVECVASDPEGGELNYKWNASGGSISGEGATTTWIAPDEVGEYVVSVNVTDGDGNWATQSVTIAVRENRWPEIVDLRASEEWIMPSGNCTINCEASDPDNDSLSYEWLASGGNIMGKGDTVTWVAPEDIGNYTITVVVTDEFGGEGSASLSIKVAFNKLPIIEDLIVTARHKYFEKIPGGYKIGQGQSCEIECEALDPDGDELFYEWSTDGGDVSGKGATVTFTAALWSGTVTVTVTVSDSNGGAATDSIAFTVVSCSSCKW